MSDVITVERSVRLVVWAVTWKVNGQSTSSDEHRGGKSYSVNTWTSSGLSTTTSSGADATWELAVEEAYCGDDGTVAYTAVLRATGGAALPLRARVRCYLRHDRLRDNREWRGDSGEVTFSGGATHHVALAGPDRGWTGSGVLSCEIELLGPVHPCPSPKSTSTFDLSSLLFESMKLSDLVLQTKTEELPAHKLVLSVRSDVFAKMFSDQFVEDTENKIALPHLDGALVRELLRFIYTNKVENLPEFAPDLLPLADQYELGELKQMCYAELHPALTVDTAVAALIVADTHHVPAAKSAAIRFIRRNYMEVQKTEDWKLMKDFPKLVTELNFADLSNDE